MEDMGRVMTAAVLAIAGLTLAWVAFAAASGKLGRNSLAGIRIPATLASDEAWLVAHQRSRSHTVAAGIIAIVGGLVLLTPMPMWAFTTVVLGAAVLVLGFVLWGVAVGSRAANDLTRKNERDGDV